MIFISISKDFTTIQKWIINFWKLCISKNSVKIHFSTHIRQLACNRAIIKFFQDLMKSRQNKSLLNEHNAANSRGKRRIVNYLEYLSSQLTWYTKPSELEHAIKNGFCGCQPAIKEKDSKKKEKMDQMNWKSFNSWHGKFETHITCSDDCHFRFLSRPVSLSLSTFRRSRVLGGNVNTASIRDVWGRIANRQPEAIFPFLLQGWKLITMMGTHETTSCVGRIFSSRENQMCLPIGLVVNEMSCKFDIRLKRHCCEVTAGCSLRSLRRFEWFPRRCRGRNNSWRSLVNGLSWSQNTGN